MSHNFYFNSDEIIDFYTGENKYNWLSWFLHPERKAFTITDDHTKLIPFGYPVFKNYRALGLRRFFPEQKLIEDLTFKANELRTKGLSEIEIKSGLNQVLDSYKKGSEPWGRYETDEEMEERYRYEIFESKKILEDKLNKKINFLCWPGGGYNDVSIKLSIDAGYVASTLASREKFSDIDNTKDYKRIDRIGTGSFIHYNGKSFLVKNKLFLQYMFRARNGNFILRVLLKIHKESVRLYLKFKKP